MFLSSVGHRMNRIKSGSPVVRRGKTLFATAGRAMPVFPLVVYSLYCTGVVAWCILGLDFKTMDLGVLSSLMNMVGTSLFLLQAFRVNSSYGDLAS